MFVDATMVNNEVISSEDKAHNRNYAIDKIPTPERVLKDMEFLKQSWANIAENDEEEASLMKDSEKEPENTTDAEGFEMILSKTQKKAQQKLKNSRRDTYTTRSKVPSKPFK